MSYVSKYISTFFFSYIQGKLKFMFSDVIHEICERAIVSEQHVQGEQNCQWQEVVPGGGGVGGING